MRYLELHNVEYGECVVFGGAKDEILMVDCGSMNRVRDEDGRELTECIGEGILSRYRNAPSRAFLLSHCHRDHLSGLWGLLGKEPKYFSQIYLPANPCDRLGRALLLEFALFVFVFQRDRTDYARANVASLRLFERFGRRMVLSQAGKAILPHMEAILRSMEAIKACGSGQRPLFRSFLEVVYTWW